MLELAVSSGCGVCAMHMQGDPQTMQENPQYEDVVSEVLEFLRARCNALLSAGIEPARIALDPGIGFGKTREHNIALLSNAWRFHALDCPVLIGHSRKRFIGQTISKISSDPFIGQTTGKTGSDPLIGQTTNKISSDPFIGHDPLPGTIGAALALARQGVQILRVHDVAAVRNALILFDACGGL